MTARHLTDNQLNQYQSETESLNIRQQQGSVETKDALERLYSIRQDMRDTLDRSLEKQSDLRVATWNNVQNLINVLRQDSFTERLSQETKFKAGDALDIEARSKVNDVNILINKMRLNGRKTPNKDELRHVDKNIKIREDGSISDEEYVRTRTAMLNDYGKYIDTEHSEMIHLRQRYMDKTVSNYMEYAKSEFRNGNRDSMLFSKVKTNLEQGKYSKPEFAQSLLNLLEPVVPRSQAN